MTGSKFLAVLILAATFSLPFEHADAVFGYRIKRKKPAAKTESPPQLSPMQVYIQKTVNRAMIRKGRRVLYTDPQVLKANEMQRVPASSSQSTTSVGSTQ